MGLSSGLPGLPTNIRSTAKLAGFALNIAWLTINSDLVLLSNAMAGALQLAQGCLRLGGRRH